MATVDAIGDRILNDVDEKARAKSPEISSALLELARALCFAAYAAELVATKQGAAVMDAEFLIRAAACEGDAAETRSNTMKRVMLELAAAYRDLAARASRSPQPRLRAARRG